MKTDSRAEGEAFYTPSPARPMPGLAPPIGPLGAKSFTPFCRVSGESCTQVSIDYDWIEVRFDVPPKPGRYELDDLHAVACEGANVDDPRERCTLVNGSLEVTALEARCGQDACGRFDGVLELHSEIVHGAIALHYAETRETEATEGCGAIWLSATQ